VACPQQIINVLHGASLAYSFRIMVLDFKQNNQCMSFFFAFVLFRTSLVKLFWICKHLLYVPVVNAVLTVLSALWVLGEFLSAQNLF